MFSEITPEISSRMKHLQALDQVDRADGTPTPQRLRQIPADVGKFLAILASTCPPGEFVEIGTSAGYSSLWISLAAQARGIRLKTYEVHPGKIELAKETFSLTSRWSAVELIEGDFLQKGHSLHNVSFCFLDCEKDIYENCFDVVAPRMVSNGLLIADNAISHYSAIKPMIDKTMSDARFDCVVVPIGNGELICRRK